MFPGLEAHPGHAFTDLVGPIDDQPHLYGVLELIRSVGLILIEVTPEE
jgi:hypothetical protein